MEKVFRFGLTEQNIKECGKIMLLMEEEFYGICKFIRNGDRF